MIPVERFTIDLFELLTETFERVQGRYLDRGTSLFETLDTISAAEPRARSGRPAPASGAAHPPNARLFEKACQSHRRVLVLCPPL